MKKLYMALAATIVISSVLPALALADTNLVANPSFETASGNTATGWSQDTAGSPGATFTIPTGSAHTGTHFAQVSIGSYVAGTDAKWDFTPVNVTAGQYYSFSDWYQSATSTYVY